MKILIVEVNWLGDVLFSTPAIKALKKRFPDSFVSCLVVPRAREILEGNPGVDEIIINDEDFLYRGLFGKMRLAKKLKSANFDLAILFHRSATRACISWLAGVPRRLGFIGPKSRLFLTEGQPIPKKDSLHRVDYYLQIVSLLGCNTDDRCYEFFTAKEDAEFVDDFLIKKGVSSGDFTVCLNPAGNWLPKRWPKENFARLADRLIYDYKAKVIFTGSDNDLQLISEIKKEMAYVPITSCGQMNLKQLACLFRKAVLVISGDSGPLHIAASQGTNIIALFGPTSIAVTAPLGRGKIKIIQKDIGCTIPCYVSDCNDNNCMRQIKVEDVLNEIGQFLPR